MMDGIRGRMLKMIAAVIGILGGALLLISMLGGCSLPKRVDIDPQIAALMNNAKEQTLALASIRSTVGANSGDNWTTRLVVVGATLFGAAWILIDRRTWHKKRKDAEWLHGKTVTVKEVDGMIVGAAKALAEMDQRNAADSK